MRRHLIAVTLAAAVIVGAACGSAADNDSVAGEPVETEPAANDETRLERAKDLAGQDAQYLDVLDDGYGLAIDGAAQHSKLGASIETIAAVFVALDAPEILYSRFDATSSLMGLQEMEFDGLVVQWTFHPDQGLDVIVEDTDR